MSEPVLAPRRASISRSTSESLVELTLDLDGSGDSSVATGVRFYDHMLASLAKHALVDLQVKATGDIDVDAHHTVEDVAIVLGDALREALGDKQGIARFGDAVVPLDEALVQAVVDVAGRPYCVHTRGAGRPGVRRHRRVLCRLADPTRVRDDRVASRHRAARARPGRTRPAPHRRGPVQGGGAGAAGSRRPRPAGHRHTERQGHPVVVSEPSPQGPRALLLLRGQVEAVARWLGKGVTPAVVAGCPHGWVAVTPASGASLAAPPYDDASSTLLARPVPRRHRPALGWRVVGPRLLVCVVPDAVAAPTRAGWPGSPVTGWSAPVGCRPARPPDLAQAAGAAATARRWPTSCAAPPGRALDVGGRAVRGPGPARHRGPQRRAGPHRPAGASASSPNASTSPAFERAVGTGALGREEREPR